jgi:hypothetical protein
VSLGIPAVGVVDAAIELAPQTLVAAGLLTRLRRDLPKADLPSMFAIPREQAAECLEPTDQAFGIVEPIDADGERPTAVAFSH